MTDQSAAPKFSVVIATYARGTMIDATLQSVAQQTMAPHEILVISDGPAAPGLTESVDAVSGARLIELPTRTRTQAGPNNEGWQQATGNWIAYLGHDDIWHPEHLVTLADTIARQPGAGFAVSGLVFLGPDRNNDDQTWVTGFFDDDDARAPLEEFFPPSSFAHRCDLGGPRWPDVATITLPVDAEFLRRQAELATRFVSTQRITVVKFASALRYLSYAVPHDDEQQWILALSEDRPMFDQFLASRLAIARDQGTFMHMKQVDRNLFVPGEIVARNEQTRGIDVGQLTPLSHSVWVPIGSGDRPPDWYPLESDDIDEWRWSGPSTTPKLLIPFTAPDSLPVRIVVHVLGFADDELREEVRVRANGRDSRISWEAGIETRMAFTTTLLEDRPTIIEILTGRTAPQEMAQNRPVGVATTGYDIELQTDFESHEGGRSRAAAEHQLEVALKRIDRMSQHPEEDPAHVEALVSEIDRLRSTLHAIRTSRSWKMTAWYRALGAWKRGR